MVSTAAVSEYIKGIHFPASKQDLVDCAKSNNAPQNVIDMIQQLPQQSFQTMNQVWEAIGQKT